MEFERSKDRCLEEAGIRYWWADEDWLVWACNTPFHCQAVSHGMGPSRNKLLCGGSEGRLGNTVFSRPERAECITSRGSEGHFGNPSK